MLVVAWPLGNFNPDAKKGNSVSMVPFMLSTLYLASWFNVYSFKFSIKTNLFLNCGLCRDVFIEYRKYILKLQSNIFFLSKRTGNGILKSAIKR